VLNIFEGRFILVVEQQFRSFIRTHCDETGFNMPAMLERYIVTLLASRIKDTELIPHPTFAERYLQISELNRASLYKEFADQCLFFVSLMPEYGKKRGLDIDYYASLGISSYYSVGDRIRDDRFIQLGNWFYTLQKFIHSAVRPKAHLDLVDLIQSDKYL
tara:strand:+ start:94 stop:573 length:480 start_codon:yes stop_codon:yes gene_type:complete